MGRGTEEEQTNNNSLTRGRCHLEEASSHDALYSLGDLGFVLSHLGP